MTIRCLLVEDHLMFMQLISTMLRSMRNMEIAGMARTVEEALQICDEQKPDLLLLDLALPDGSGLEVARHLVKLNPGVRIIILSGEMETFVCPAALKNHVYEIVDKSGAFEEVERAIKDCLQEMLKSFPGQTGKRNEQPAKDAQLSKRENEVYTMIGAGMMSKEIADQLGLSIHTIHVFRKRIAEKMGISGNEMSREAIRQYQSSLGRDSRL